MGPFVFLIQDGKIFFSTLIIEAYMDCEKLTPNALKIFEQIKRYYPPDPWGNPQWKKRGLVYDNGWHDLRKEKDREKLIGRYENQIGATTIIFAMAAKQKGEKLTRSVFNFKMFKKWIELALLLRDLDFQIETLDLVE